MLDHELFADYAEYLISMNNHNRKKPIDQEEHPLREQLWNMKSALDVERDEAEIKLNDDITPLDYADVLEILYSLAKWGNKQDKRYWEQQISVS